jgi:hypothetical protein
MNEALSRFKALSPVRQAAIVGITAWNLWLIATAQRSRLLCRLGVARCAGERDAPPQGVGLERNAVRGVAAVLMAVPTDPPKRNLESA